MRTLLVILALNSSLASLVSASSVGFQSVLKGPPSCALNCATYRSAQRQCLTQSHYGNNKYNFDTCFCDLFLSSGLGGAKEEDRGNSGFEVCSASCTRDDDMNALMKWSQNKCHRAGMRRQQPAAAGDAAAAAPADPAPAAPAAGDTAAAAPGAAATADTGNQAGQNGQAGQKNQDNQNQPANNDAATQASDGTPTVPVQSASSTESPSPTESVHFPEEPKEKPSEWPKKYGRWLAMAIVLVVGFTALTIFLVWLRRRIHRKRAEEHARLQEQALDAASSSSGGKPGMSGNPLISESNALGQQPQQQLLNQSRAAAADGNNSDLESNTPVVGFSHAPGTRYTAYDHMLAEQQLQEEELRQRSASGSAFSKISSLFGRAPKSPRDMISSRKASPSWNMAGEEIAHSGETDQLTYPAPAETGRS